MHLTAPRALGDDIPVGLKFAAEGSEEQGTGAGSNNTSPSSPEEFLADALLVCDTGNAEVGVGTATITLRGLANLVVAVDTLHGEVHSGMFGAPAPDAVAASESKPCRHSSDPETGARPASTRLDCDGTWEGVGYDERTVPSFDAGVLDGVQPTGTGSVADRLWARPAVTVLGIDCPPVVSSASVPLHSTGRVSLRVPPTDADEALTPSHRPSDRRSLPVRGSRWSRKAPGPRLRARSPTARRRRAREAMHVRHTANRWHTSRQGGSICATCSRRSHPAARNRAHGCREPSLSLSTLRTRAWTDRDPAHGTRGSTVPATLRHGVAHELTVCLKCDPQLCSTTRRALPAGACPGRDRDACTGQRSARQQRLEESAREAGQPSVESASLSTLCEIRASELVKVVTIRTVREVREPTTRGDNAGAEARDRVEPGDGRVRRSSPPGWRTGR